MVGFSIWEAAAKPPSTTCTTSKAKPKSSTAKLVLLPMTSGLHGFAVLEIAASVRDYARRTRRGHAVGDSVGFVVNLPNRRSFCPDAAFCTQPLTNKFIDGAPIFAVEVRSDEDYGSAGERAMPAKRDDYFAAGSQVVWDVDVQREQLVRVYPREQGVITVRAFSRAICGAVAIAAAVACAAIVLSGQAAPGIESRVDAVFAKWTGTTPGCAVGVAANGKPSLAKGYGMADLEHDVRITPDSIFEAGSVSKQFTAASVLLLARAGKLSLDDPVRKYIPELPDYESPAPPERPGGESGRVALTIRHMLTHTSGLRDWGSVAGIAGWPRTTRVHTHAHVLDIVSRQRALNFTPGTRWSYSNTGFNLAAIIVSRVSGTPFPEFTRAHLFQPLGMAHTSWRDDYTRIVNGRAMAYAERDGGYHTDMPFENVYGNGGLLTTIGDLLKWNENFTSPIVGDASFVAEQQQVGKFSDGRPHGYGLGLFVGTHQGLREVYHSGSTAGYSAFLTRFPDRRVSVAVLCNATSAQATQYAHAVADLFLGERLKGSDPVASYTLTGADIDRIAGLYRSDDTGLPVTIAREKDGLRADRVTLLPQSALRFLTAGRQVWEADAHGLRRTDEFGTVEEFARVVAATPTAQALGAYAGTYESVDAETVLTASVDNGKLVLKRRPDTTIALTPIYADVFGAGGLGTVIFLRDARGRPTELSVRQDRVWDLRFIRSR